MSVCLCVCLPVNVFIAHVLCPSMCAMPHPGACRTGAPTSQSVAPTVCSDTDTAGGTRWAKPRTQPPAPSGAPSPQAHPPPRRTRCPPCAQTQTRQHVLSQGPHPAACPVGRTLPTGAPPTSRSVAPTVCSDTDTAARVGPSPAPSRLPRRAHPLHRRTPHLAERGALRVLRHRHSSTLWAKPRTQPPAASGAPSPHARPPPRRAWRPP